MTTIATNLIERVRQVTECCLSDDNHLIENGRWLLCGGYACTKCLQPEKQIQSNNDQVVIKCNYCSNEHVLNCHLIEQSMDAKMTIDLLLETSLNSFFEQINNKFQKKLDDMENELNDYVVNICSAIEEQVEEHVNKIKSTFDALLQQIKEKLGTCRTRMRNFIPQNELNEMRKYANEYVSVNNKSLSMIYDYQNQLKSYQDRLNQFKNDLPKIDFIKNVEFIDGLCSNHIGKLNTSFDIMHISSVSSLNTQNQVNSRIEENQVNESVQAPINDFTESNSQIEQILESDSNTQTEQNQVDGCDELDTQIEQNQVNGCDELDTQIEQDQLLDENPINDEEMIAEFKEEPQTVDPQTDILLNLNEVESKIDLNIVCDDISRFCMIDNSTFAFADYLKGKFNIVRINITEYMLEYNPDNELVQPFGVCFDGINKLFIGDFVLRKIIVYDVSEHPVKIKEYGDDIIEAIDTINLDRETGYLYVCDANNDVCTIWHSTEGNYINRLSIESPSSIAIVNDKLFIASFTSGEYDVIMCKSRNKKKRRLSGNCKNNDVTNNIDRIRVKYIDQGENCIFIVNKNTLIKERLIKENWFNPRGLHVAFDGLNYNIFTVAMDKDKNGYLSQSEYLYVLDIDGTVKRHIELGFDNVYDFAVLHDSNSIVFVRGCDKPSCYLVKFK